MKEQMLDALRLSSDTGFLLTRLVIIWRNERWRQMTTRRCETTVGRATFQITTWDWMICHRIDDFRFMAFRQALYTLAQLPGDAARLVSSQDWKEMSAALGAERTQEQVQELFYPGRSGKPVNDASERNPKLLRALDDRGYWDVYERILRTPALRFPDIQRITGLSQGQGRVLLQVPSHVVDWLTSERTKITNSRRNDKPPLRKDLEPALDYYAPARLRQAEKRLKVFFPPAAPPQSSRESASLLLHLKEVPDMVIPGIPSCQTVNQPAETCKNSGCRSRSKAVSIAYAVRSMYERCPTLTGSAIAIAAWCLALQLSEYFADAWRSDRFLYST